MSSGLTESEAAARLAARGARREPTASRSTSTIVKANALTPFNAILLALGLLTLVFGDWRDALFLGIIVANTAIGIWQELRAKLKLDELAALVAPSATVVRAGEPRQVHVSEVVVGDLVWLGTGDQVVADGPLRTAVGLHVDESILTGESQAVGRKIGEAVRSGSFVVEGTGSFEVDAVGDESYAGRITGTAREFRHPRSPLERAIDRLAVASSTGRRGDPVRLPATVERPAGRRRPATCSAHPSCCRSRGLPVRLQPIRRRGAASSSWRRRPLVSPLTPMTVCRRSARWGLPSSQRSSVPGRVTPWRFSSSRASRSRCALEGFRAYGRLDRNRCGHSGTRAAARRRWAPGLGRRARPDCGRSMCRRQDLAGGETPGDRVAEAARTVRRHGGRRRQRCPRAEGVASVDRTGLGTQMAKAVSDVVLVNGDFERACGAPRGSCARSVGSPFRPASARGSA